MPKRHKKKKKKTKTEVNPQEVKAQPTTQSPAEETKDSKKPSIREAAAVEKLAIARTPQDTTVKKLSGEISAARMGNQDTVDLGGASVRQFVTAEVTDRTQTVQKVDLKQASHKDFIKATGWKTIGTGKKFGPVVTVKEGKQETKVQFNPARGQTGNYKIPILGDYGRGKPRDILHVVNDLCDNDRKKEQLLAKHMLESLRQRRPLSEFLGDEFDRTSDEEIAIDEAFVAKRDAFFLHIAYLEVSRRHGPSAHNGHKTRSLPIALALFLSLELIEAGKITMGEVFGKNAEYGLPTGTEINTKKGFKLVEKKWDNLINFYELHFKALNISDLSAIERLHKKYREYAGDESSDTDYSSKVGDHVSKSTSVDSSDESSDESSKLVNRP